MARKKWSDSARKKQSKTIKKMWADKKKTEDTREPWVIAQEKREADRGSRSCRRDSDAGFYLRLSRRV